MPVIRFCLVLLVWPLVASFLLAPAGAQGCVANNQIGGVVYRDYDASGTRGSLEPGVSGVTVSAYGPAGTLLASATTASDGSYVLSVSNSTPTRIEFTTLPVPFKTGPAGPQSVTTTAFVRSPDCSVDLGINRRDEYCESDPRLVTPLFIHGESIGNTMDGMVSIQYSASGIGGGMGGVPQIKEAAVKDIGACLGLASQASTNSVFAGAFMKRHVAFGPGGTGAIYRVDRNTTTVSTFLNLNALFGAGTAGVNPHPGGVGHDFDRDLAPSFDSVGKIALGDLELTALDNTLWAVNLADKMLYKMPIGDPPVAPTMGMITRFPIPLPPGVLAGDFRPCGLGLKEGILYVGSVDSAESTVAGMPPFGDRTQMRGFVYSFDPSTSTFSASPVLSFPLDYPRSCAGLGCSPVPGGKRAADWLPWVTNWTIINDAPGNFAIYPQPFLSDIAFDGDYMQVGIRDRMSDQGGYLKFSSTPGDMTIYDTVSAGDTLLAAPDGMGGWVIESNAAAGTRGPTLGAGTGQGPGGGEFYFEERFGVQHDEVSMGGLAQLPGFPDLPVIMFDPFAFYEQGIMWMSNTTGARVRAARIYQALPPPGGGAGGLAGKAAGLGDLEAICLPPPVEIGNRAWADTNRNGIQDAAERGIAGLTVRLYTSGGMLLATQLTDAEGLFVFNDANVGAGVLRNTAYEIRFDNLADFGFGAPSFGWILSPTGAGTTLSDSNGVTLGSGFPGVALTTGDFGENNHTLDFGFQPPIGSIGDYIWHDRNCDGVQDADEPGIASVIIHLYGPGYDGVLGTPDDTLIDTQFSDYAGGYDFLFLPPGNYRVAIDESTLPPGYGLTTGNMPFDHVLPSGQDFNDADLGYKLDPCTGSIGDFVWDDLDGDAVQDGGEPGLPGVLIDLIDPGPDGIFDTADDFVAVTTTTDGMGGYLFTGVCAGLYRARVNVTTLPPGVVPTTPGGSKRDIIVIIGGPPILDVDFGYRIDPMTGSIGDFIWSDTDGDGVQDGGEPGIDGVIVNLREAGPNGIFGDMDDVTYQTTTAGGGLYSFNALPAGCYRVDVDNASGPIVGLGITTGNDPLIVKLTQAQTFTAADFGYGSDLMDGRIGDFVWHDLDQDGIQDPSELGLPGVMVRLLGAGPDGLFGTMDDVVVATRTTNGSGHYEFGMLSAGHYRVDVVESSLPPALISSTTLNEPFDVVLTTGQIIVTADFGYADPVTGVIGDFVWQDTDGDGVQDGGELGIGGVTVRLFIPGLDGILGTGDDLVLLSAMTDAFGRYSFPGLAAGNYRVDIDDATLPAGYVLTTGNEPLTVTLGAGQNFSTADFGYVLDQMNATIGDFVWSDANLDGVQDMGELGIPGVVVRLFAAGPDGLFGTPDDQLVSTTTTNGAGAYLFSDLPGGTYRVDVDGATVTAGFVSTTFNDPLLLVLLPGQSRSDADFGYAFDTVMGSIGDFVWSDTNGNGVFDGGEPGLDGVTVRLLTHGPDGILGTMDDVVLATQATAGGGAYDFTMLPGGAYLVDVVEGTLPPASVLTTANEPLQVLLAVGQDFNQADFGYLADPLTGQIGDFVWYDFSRDGTFDEGIGFEIAGAEVWLYTPGADGVFLTPDDFLVGSMITDANGFYLFTGLAAGEYRVVVDTFPYFGAFAVCTTMNEPLELTLAPGQQYLTADFGYDLDLNTAEVGDFVWEDRNRDGVQDVGEPGIAGVSVTGTDPGGDGLFGTGDDVVGMLTTNGSGVYLFQFLPEGTYRVDIDESSLPAGLSLTTGNEPMTVTIVEGESFLAADFGYYRDRGIASIGDFVWNDLDGDGIQDSGEPGIPGVMLNLIVPGMDMMLGTMDDVVLRDIVTDAQGFYTFFDLPAGSYRVDVVEASLPPALATLTSFTEPIDVALLAEEQFVAADFGYYDPATASIGDFVWSDADLDGVQDAGELGISNVTVRLFIPGPDGTFGTIDDFLQATQITDSFGFYRFSGLLAGQYLVDVLDSTVPTDLATTTGNDPLDVTLSTAQVFVTADFGYAPITFTGEIGDLVWEDADADGTLNGGETGIPGVNVRLIVAGGDGLFGTTDDIVVATTTTDGMGLYLFTGLPPGNYHIDVDGTTLPAGFVSTTFNDPQLVMLRPIPASFLDADFGYRFDLMTASIGDFIWGDADCDGVQDGGELGLSGVTVRLFSAGMDGLLGTLDDVLEDTQVTNGSGAYDFTGLGSGNYQVVVDDSTVPAALGLSTGNDPLTVFVASEQDMNAADFGYCTETSTGFIGDFVWWDVDCDGIQDGGEPGLVGVLLRLLGPGPDDVLGTIDDTQIGITPTMAGGLYMFLERPAGRYRVDVVESSLPAGWVLTTGNEPLNIILSVGQVFTTADFGYKPNVASIGDLVWLDNNGDGIRDMGEPGIATVLMRLISPGSDGIYSTPDDIVLATQLTDGDGTYLFSGLAAGRYRVSVDESSAPLVGLGITTSNNPLDITLNAGQTFVDADFGYIDDPATGSIGDFVWQDLDDDTIQDAGEPGLAGVTVRLLRAGADGIFGTMDDVVQATTVTDGMGGYDFTGLLAGNYQIDIVEGTLPGGLVETTNLEPLEVRLSVAQDFNTADFGYDTDPLTGSIGDLVWRDSNSDAMQTFGEPGIGAVIVDLFTPGVDGLLGTGDDVLQATQVTGNFGSYLFSGLAAGQYSVNVRDASAPLAGLTLTTGNEPLFVTLAAGQSFLTADFGYSATPRLGSIGDFVWYDIDGDAVQDPGEPGLGGVILDLTTPGMDGSFGTMDDMLIASTTTNSSGWYLFAGLPSGRYLVDIDEATLPAGLTLTTSNEPLVVMLASAQNFNTADFGYDDPSTGSIGDFVWNDVDGDTVQDGGEAGLAGVTVRLLIAGPDGILGTVDDVVALSQTTDGMGGYLFSGLDAGTYRVDVLNSTVPPTFGITTGNDPLEVTLTAAQNFLTADFGYRVDPLTGSIGDVVWRDTNRDGIFAAEVGIAAVTVRLLAPGPDGLLGTMDDVVVATMPTDVTGFYDFGGLAAGNYLVDVVEATLMPAGLAETTAIEPLVVMLSTGQDFDDADFGYELDTMTGSIGDLVWRDSNANRIPNVGEPGIAGATVRLFTPGVDGIVGTGDDVLASTMVTNAAGNYLFTMLAAGLYNVIVDETTIPAGFGITTANNPLRVSLAGGQTFLDADFGYRPDPLSGTIGDLVWLDDNTNAQFDAGEGGIPGVTVNLIGAGPDMLLGTMDDVALGSAITDGSGNYLFTGLPGGDYRVDIDESTLPPNVGLTTANEPMPVRLTAGQNFLEADFGYGDPRTGSIGDFVWFDGNGDTVQDVGEPGIAGVSVRLLLPGLDGIFGTIDDRVLATRVTDSMGGYDFTMLPAGGYRVDVEAGPALAGLGLTTGNDPLDVVLAAGQDFNTADFGYVPDTLNSSIGDFVWNDIDGDAVQDGGAEVGIAGVTVLLKTAGLDGLFGTADDVTVAMDTTDGMGLYGFTGLAAGNYQVDVLDSSPALMGFAGTTVEPRLVTLSVGETFLLADFGYLVDPLTGSIGDLVWRDLDEDGIRDFGEPGIAGVTVSLLGAGPDGIFGNGDDLTMIAPLVTNGAGFYDFVGLAAGRYRVDVDETTLPATYGLTTGNEPLVVVLSGGQDYGDADFGYNEDFQFGLIGDFVWRDYDNDGLQDVGEPGLETVRLQLISAGPDGVLGNMDDIQLGVTATDANGIYYFLDLPAGIYRVDVYESTVPAGLMLTTGNEPLDIRLALGQVFLRADFGYNVLVPPTSGIGDTVFYDTNGDGIENAGESGISNVVLELLLGGVPTLQTTVTGVDGSYFFPSLAPGSYSVRVANSNFDPGGALENLVSTTGGQVHGPVGLVAGFPYLDADFGYRAVGFSIGDFVWSDADNDGAQDPGEPGIPGVTLELYLQDLMMPTGYTLVGTAVTNGSGHYLFTGLAMGLYHVEVVAANFNPGGPLDGYTVTVGPESIGSDRSGNFGLGAMPPDQVSVDVVDFGYFRAMLGSIGDLVYYDLDLDGIGDPGEPGFASVSLNLYSDTNGNGMVDAGEPLVATTTTDSMGNYLFTGLSAGNYIVDVSDVAGVLTAFSLTTGNEPLSVMLMAGQSFLDADFGYGAVGLGDYVWFDRDADGVQDPGETGISGVTVNIYRDLNANGIIDATEGVMRTAITSLSGYYNFPMLDPGPYLVAIPASQFLAGLAGFTSSPAGVGGDPAADSNGIFDAFGNLVIAFNLGVATNLTLDFGLTSTGMFSIGNFIWLDSDCDGIQDPGEPGIAGVTVELFRDLNGDGIVDPMDPHLASTVSDGGGIYTFAMLPPGNYIVVISDYANVLAGLTESFGGPTAAVMGLMASTNIVDFGFCDDRPLMTVVSSFRALHEGAATVVTWETMSELDTAGFFLYRLDVATGTWAQVNAQLIAAQQFSLEGANYYCVDPAATLGGSYAYKLAEVESSGRERFHGPFAVIVKAGPPLIRGSQPYGRAARVPAQPTLSSQAQAARAGREADRRRERRVGTVLKINVVETGMVRLEATEIAARMGAPLTTVRTWITSHALALENRGQPVPYRAATDGASLSFYGSSLDQDDLYGDVNVYWLRTGTGREFEAESGFSSAASALPSTSFTQVSHFEESHFWQAPVDRSVDPLLDFWFWDFTVAGVPSLESKRFVVQTQDLVPSADLARVYLRLRAGSVTPHHVAVSLNGTSIGESIWTNSLVHEVAFEIPSSMLLEGDNTVTLRAVQEQMAFDFIWLDCIDLVYPCQLVARAERLQVTGLADHLTTIGGFHDPEIYVYDVTDPDRPVWLNESTVESLGSEYRVSFRSQGPERVYVAVAPAGEMSPAAIFADQTSHLLDPATQVEYLVIAPSELLAPAQRLADYRASQGMSVLVVDFEDVLDEFNHGIASPAAITRFLRQAAQSWQNVPRFVVLAGDGSYDNKGYVSGASSLLPPLFVPTSHGLFPSDAMLLGRDPLLVGHTVVGRIPAATAAEFDGLVTKIIGYEAQLGGTWTSTAVFVADNLDAQGNFSQASDAAAAGLSIPSAVGRAYLDYHTVSETRVLVADGLSSGAGFLCYIGHAGLTQLAEENLFSVAGVSALPPTTQLPIFVASSCLVGNFSVPGFPSLGEALVARADGGAIAVWLPSGLTLAQQGNSIVEAFVRAGANATSIGDQILRASAQVRAQGHAAAALDTMVLLGDPALRIKR